MGVRGVLAWVGGRGGAGPGTGSGPAGGLGPGIGAGGRCVSGKVATNFGLNAASTVALVVAVAVAARSDPK